MNASTSPFLTVPEAAAYVRLSVSRLRELYLAGDIPSLRTGRRGQKVLFAPAALERWVMKRGSTRKNTRAKTPKHPESSSGD